MDSLSALFPAFEADAMTAMIEREPVGADNVADLILLNYKGADFVGHKYGPDSSELRVTLGEMDRHLTRMLRALEAKVGNNYLLAVTADHGMPSEPSSPDRRHFAQSIVDLLHEKFDFTKDEKFLMQVGHYGKNAGSNDLENFGRVAKIWVDPKTNEAYIADGYLNRRVAVLDADTGKMKRYWGAYGNKPEDGPNGNYDPKAPPSKQFRNPVHCVERTNDGLVYVCDRRANRLQVYDKMGGLKKNIDIPWKLHTPAWRNRPAWYSLQLTFPSNWSPDLHWPLTLITLSLITSSRDGLSVPRT